METSSSSVIIFDCPFKQITGTSSFFWCSVCKHRHQLAASVDEVLKELPDRLALLNFFYAIEHNVYARTTKTNEKDTTMMVEEGVQLHEFRLELLLERQRLTQLLTEREFDLLSARGRYDSTWVYANQMLHGGNNKRRLPPVKLPPVNMATIPAESLCYYEFFFGFEKEPPVATLKIQTKPPPAAEVVEIKVRSNFILVPVGKDVRIDLEYEGQVLTPRSSRDQAMAVYYVPPVKRV